MKSNEIFQKSRKYANKKRNNRELNEKVQWIMKKSRNSK
jgi:hypothetical protein